MLINKQRLWMASAYTAYTAIEFSIFDAKEESAAAEIERIVFKD